MMRSVALAACLVLPLTGAALAQTGGPVNPGSGPSAGGTVDTNTPASRGPATTAPGAATAPGSTTGTVAPGTAGNGAGPSAGGTVNKNTPANR